MEWVAYLIADEGWNAYHVGKEVPPDALREVLTLVPSKWKGKGFGKKGDPSKGKGKGKVGTGSKGGGKSGHGKSNASQFNGNCHDCGAYGHRAADCTQLENLGESVAKGTSVEGIEMKIDFDIANVTRPLLSIHKMTSNGHKVIFHDNGC